MSEEMTNQESQNDQGAYDVVFDAVAGVPGAADPAPKKEAAPAPKPAQEIENPPVEKTAEQDKLIFGKYKSMEDAAEAFKNLETYTSGVKEFWDLKKALKNPETQAQAVAEFTSKFGIKLPEAKPEEKKPEPGEISDLSQFDDDEIINGRDLKKALPGLVAQLVAQAVGNVGKTPEMEKVMSVIKPILEQQHMETIKSRGGIFALYDDPALAAVRNQIIEADETGAEGRDVHAHYAALGKLIDDAVRSEGAQLPDLLTSLVRKKNAQPETGSGHVNQPAPRVEISEEDAEENAYMKMIDNVPGR